MNIKGDAMKNLSMILASLLMGTAPIQADPTSNGSLPQVRILPDLEERNQKLGAEAVASIRKAYENGDYDQFLKELDDLYQSAQESGELEALASTRPGLSPVLQKWGNLANQLQIEKKTKLLDAIQSHEDSFFIKKVKSAANNPMNEEQEMAAERIAAFRQMTLGSGSNSDENLLISLDLEYEFKALNLYHFDTSPQDRREKQYALKMEKLDCIKHLSKQFQDPSLKEAASLYAEQHDARLAQFWDMADLNQLANGEIKPSSAEEEKVLLVLQVYQEKFSDLTKQFVAEHEKN